MPAKRKASEAPEDETAAAKAPAAAAVAKAPAAAAETKEGELKPTVAEFRALLESTPETKEACATWFRACADALLNHFELVVANKHIYRFVEIEFYYNDKNAHQDTFIHGTDMQLKTAGHWYFHTSGASSTSYKSGTYKGLDLTFGKPGKIPGGILLRAMQSSSGAVIEGPCMLVDRLLKDNDKTAIIELVKCEGFSLCATDVNPVMYIRPAKPIHRALVASPRVGLTLKRHDAFKETFVMMPYRMTSLTTEIKKNRQTIVVALLAQDVSAPEVVKITGAKKSTVDEISRQLKTAAATKKVPSDWNGATLNTEALIALFAACQRAGHV